MAAAELLRRMDATEQLIPFTEYTLPIYLPADHHRLIAKRLEAIERGEIDRLMIFMPPRHGKSELGSRRFPAWYLGRNPDKSVIAASYNSDLATDFGREVRNIVNAPEYRCVFDTTLAVDSKAANRWHTDVGGVYVAAGVGTAVTGRGADVFLIDDPVKDREEADSEIKRQRVWDWYTSTAYTRLAPSGAIVLIQTRWHEDDLAGRLLESQDAGGDQWEVLDLPAIDAQGSALWPERYGMPALDRIKAAIGPRDWTALYQQRPAPDEGLYFKRDWIQYYDELPAHLHKYGASDYAVTADGGDWTVHGVAGVDQDDNLYLLDWWRGQTDSDVWIENVIDLMRRHKPLQWGEENGQIIKSVGPFLTQRMNEHRVYCSREQYASAADKPTRARSFQARMSMGKVWLPRPENKPWVADLISELLTFPAGKDDDQVDVLSLFGRMLDEMVGGTGPGARREPEDRWDKAFRKADRGRTKSYKVL
ncbi:MAG: phage terminase large subunit [Rhodobacteraceae bacterium]|nr:phage terminase large subunit [Paracoccaceae bacterium]